MKKTLIVLIVSFFISASLQAQIRGESYVYDRDTTIIGSDSSIFEVENLGETVNSSHVESGPRISPDGKSLYFFRINHPKNVAGTRDIWVSNFQEEDSTWSRAKHLGSPLNCHGPNGVHWISPDGNTMLVHNTYLKNGTMGNGVSITSKKNDEWSMPEALKIKKYKNEEVCSFILSDDMSVLIMCIKQKDTRGKQDLYVSQRIRKNKFSKPVNMGSTLNTVETEATAWLNHTSDTLYFSSNGHPNSVGGMDVYKSARTSKENWTSWTTPQNIGIPYNTTDDEYYFSIPDEGDYIYMAHHFENLSDSVPHSDIVRMRLKEKKIDPFLVLTGDIYDDFSKEKIPGKISIKLKDKDQVVLNAQTDGADQGFELKVPGTKVYTYAAEALNQDYLITRGELDLSSLKNKIEDREMKIYVKRKAGLLLSGFIFDESTKNKIPGNVEVTFSDGDQIIKTLTIDQLKGYQLYLEPGKKYDVKFQSYAYLSKIETYDLRNVDQYEERKIDVFLQPLEGASFELKNIFFASSKAELLSESFEELDRLVKIMKDYPTILVEISGHTDDQGSDNYNLELSQNRAQSVVNYLVRNGIPRIQFLAKGYGETKPVATNETTAGRQLNRRVEFKVLKIK